MALRKLAPKKEPEEDTGPLKLACPDCGEEMQRIGGTRTQSTLGKRKVLEHYSFSDGSNLDHRVIREAWECWNPVCRREEFWRTVDYRYELYH